MTSAVGELVTTNVVSTYCTRIDGIPLARERLESLNVYASTLAASSKMSLDVFPASISRCRILIRGASDPAPPQDQLYPLKKRRFTPGHGRKRRRPQDAENASGTDEDDDDHEDEEDDEHAALEREILALSVGKVVISRSTATEKLRPRAFITATNMSYQSKEHLIAGGRSEVENLLVAYAITRFQSWQQGIYLRVCNVRTQNIVCLTWLGFELNLA